AQELESIATAITRQQLSLHKQLTTVKNELRSVLHDLAASKEELREAQSRLNEIDAFLDDVAVELEELQQSEDANEQHLAAKENEQEQLMMEREDEVALLVQLQNVHDLHLSVATHLRQMLVHLMRELTKMRNQEQLLAMLALRSGVFKLMRRKLL
ncbi:hypothetical protein Poli38472_014952, partial [Pythium oligandrum]